jgi:hypothetical protein
VSRNISDGLQRIDGGEADAHIAMWPIGARIKRGQRIRVQIAGSIHPVWAATCTVASTRRRERRRFPAHQRLLLGPTCPP